MATQTKRAPTAAPSRPRRRCWRCPKVRRPNRATQLRLGLGAVAQAVATGRRLQPPVGALASVHQACRPSRREFRLRVVPTTVLDPSATFPAVLRAWSGLVFAGRRWSVGFLGERTQIRWKGQAPAQRASIPAHRGARPLDPLLLLLLVATSITAAALGGPAWRWSRMGVSYRRR